MQQRTEAVTPDGFVRLRMLETGFKYPLLRLREEVARDPATGEELVRRRSVMVGDHLIVVLRAEATERDLESLVRTLGGHVRRAMHTPGHYLVAFADAALDTVPERAAAFGAAGDVVARAEPDYLVWATTTPNDPSYIALWGMPKISAPQAWDVHTGAGDCIVAVIDTGVDYRHGDLAANMWTNPGEIPDNGLDDDGNGFIDDYYGYDFYNKDGDPFDDRDHGTHVAGTIGALGNNALGVAGVIWDTRIMALKFIGANGSGPTSDAIDALHYSTLMRQRGVNVRLTNNSWGGPDNSAALRDAIAASGAAGMLFIAAAGNEGDDLDDFPHYPAAHPEACIITVANTDEGDGLRTSSNYGLIGVDLGAPGTSIMSTMPHNGYAMKTGTSMAAPHVTGAACLIWDLFPHLTAAEVRDALFAGVDPLVSLAGKTVTGGRLNVYRALQTIPPHIEHAPIDNLVATFQSIPVEARVDPAALIATNGVRVIWKNSWAPALLRSAILKPVSNNVFRGAIDGQLLGSVVSYYLEASTSGGLTARSPTNAPAAWHSFELVMPVNLWVTARPAEHGAPSPPYGVVELPTRSTVVASVQELAEATDSQRYRCRGWHGVGSVPVSGTTTSVTFKVGSVSSLEWLWDLQYALHQTSSIPGAVNTRTWWTEKTAASTVTAPGEARYQGTDYRLAEWRIDGNRWPDATSTAQNPALGVTMTASRRAEAVYLPSDEDRDGDGLPDWWERFQFGSLAPLAESDPDGDGYTNRQEFDDRTDPRVSTSRPSPPDIVHSPLADPQRRPAPWTVRAVVTDNFLLADTRLLWRQAGGAWNQTAMSPAGAADEYAADIPGPEGFGFTNEYRIVAVDAAGYTNETGIHRFFVAYPVIGAAPEGFAVRLRPQGATNLVLSLLNSGNATLAWQGGTAWRDDLEHGAKGWTHAGSSDAWHVSARRAGSPSRAWYCGVEGSYKYTSSLAATLDTPPLPLGASPSLRFRHWIDTELDNGNPGQAYDGGIVEVSADGGPFVQVTPVGGYPYVTHPHQNSAWTNTIPIYAGTGEWQDAVFDLSAYAGRQVVIRFRFGSDWNTESEGWYIDDVTLGPSRHADAWLTLVPAAGRVAPGGITNLAVRVAAESLSGGDQDAVLRLLSDDPVMPVVDVPVFLSVRSAPRVGLLSAGQTSTNGTGEVTVRHWLYDADSEPCDVELEVSLDGGASWTAAFVRDAAGQEGALSVSNAGGAQALNARTGDASGPVTNTVALRWSTTNAVPPVVLHSAVRARIRAWDGAEWSAAATSSAFRVDNEAPGLVSGLGSSSHVPGVWSRNPAVSLGWAGATDGAGVGLRGYDVEFTDGGAPAHLKQIAVAGTSSTGPALSPDGTGWWARVCAVDLYGNRGGGAAVGPFWIDATPPDPAGATVTIARSPFGDYVVGGVLTSAWSGFTDAGAGISNYYIGLVDGGGTTAGSATLGLTGVVAGATTGRTNTVYVWAADRVGGIGQAAAASVLVLAPAVDFDGDGMMTSDEEIAGTDARDAASAFVVEATPADGAPGRFVVSWESVAGRRYGVHRRAALGDAGWLPLAGFTNLPGTGATMCYTGTVSEAASRFYRVTVEP